MNDEVTKAKATIAKIQKACKHGNLSRALNEHSTFGMGQEGMSYSIDATCNDCGQQWNAHISGPQSLNSWTPPIKL